MTSTLITAFISPFAKSLDNQKRSLIPSMYAIFMADLYISPVIQLADIPGFLKRHILGPRAPDQRRMNANFKGTEYQLSARYTVRLSRLVALKRRNSSLTSLGFQRI